MARPAPAAASTSPSSTSNDERPRNARGGAQARAALVGVVAAAAAFLVWTLRVELVVLFAAVFFGTALHRAATFLGGRTGVPHGAAVALLFTVVLAGIGGFFAFAGQRISDQYRELGDRLPAALRTVEDEIARVPVLGGLSGQIREVREGMTGGGDDTSDSGEASDGDRMFRVVRVTLRSLGHVALVIVVAFYVAWDGRRYVRSLVRVAPPERRDVVRDWLDALGRALPWWLVGRLASMAIVAGLTAPGLALLGIPLAMVLGLTAGLFSFVPVLGPLAAVVPAALVTLEAAPSSLVWVLALYAAVQFVESWIITPRIQEFVSETPPVLLLSAQLVAGVLVGLWGVMFSTPIALAGLVTVQVLWLRHGLGEDVETPGARSG